MSKPAFLAENLSQAMGRVRNAKKSDLVLDRGSHYIPKSTKYKRDTLRHSNMDKSAQLYGANTKTPYATNVIKNPVLGWEFAVDDVQRLNEKVTKRREFRYFIEAYISLSPRKRRRTFKMILFPPFSLTIDPESFLDSRRHQEHMAARSAHTGHFITKVQGFVGEDDREELAEYDPGFMDPARDHDWHKIQSQNVSNVSWDGFIRKLQDLGNGVHEGVNYHRFKPQGDVMVRLSLDDSFGIIFDLSSLQHEGPRDLVDSWLRDIRQFTSGENRKYYWDEKIRAYRQINSDDHVPPANAVQMLLDDLANNMENVHHG